MLVLAQKVDDRIFIKLPDGREMEVVVVDIRKTPATVRLGFKAPQDVQIWRENAKNKLPKSRV